MSKRKSERHARAGRAGALERERQRKARSENAKLQVHYRDSKTGRFASKTTYRRSKSHGGKRYKKEKPQAQVVPNQEYYVTIIDRQRGSRKGKKKVSPLPPKQPGAKGQTHYLPDFIVVQDRGISETAVVAYLIYWIETELSEDNRWWANVMRHAWATQRIVVASGPEISEPHGVKLN